MDQGRGIHFARAAALDPTLSWPGHRSAESAILKSERRFIATLKNTLSDSTWNPNYFEVYPRKFAINRCSGYEVSDSTRTGLKAVLRGCRIPIFQNFRNHFPMETLYQCRIHGKYSWESMEAKSGVGQHGRFRKIRQQITSIFWQAIHPQLWLNEGI